MAQRPPAAPSAVDRAEALMARRREPAAPVPPPERPGPSPIPTLTDLVSGPAPAASPPARPPHGPAPEREPEPAVDILLEDDAGAVAPASQAFDAAALEQAVFERLKDRLDEAVSDLLERTLVPELAARLAQATRELADELRVEVSATVAAALRERNGPGGGKGR